MHKGNREKLDYMSRRSLLLAIGEAGAAASVLDPEPTFKKGDPIYRFYPYKISMDASRNGFQEGGRGPEKEQKQGLPTSEKRSPEEELELSRYDHAA